MSVSASSPAHSRFLPYVVAKQHLDPKALQPSATNLMAEKTVQEFKKTGNALAQDPWQLLKTQAWLDNVCDQNKARIFADPVALAHIFQPAEFLLPLRSIDDIEMEAPEPAPALPAPRMVTATRAKKKARAQPVFKRPAGAQATAAGSHDHQSVSAGFHLTSL